MVDRSLLAACTAVNPVQACVGSCWTLMLRTLNAFAAKDPAAVKSLQVKQGCLQGILNHFRRMDVDQNIINSLTACPISTGPQPPAGPKVGTKLTCPVATSRLSQAADIDGVLSTCNDQLPVADICTKCLSAIFKASSQLLQFYPEEQRKLTGGCFFLVLNELVINLPPGSILPEQIEQCIEAKKEMNFTKAPCPISDIFSLPAQSVLALDVACDAVNLQGGRCLLCQGALLPAVLTVPKLDPRNDYILSDCTSVVTQTFITQRTSNESHAYAVTQCFKATTEALAPGVSPYETDELAPFPDFPLEAPKGAPVPAPDMAPAPAPSLITLGPAEAPIAIITNITTIDPNLSPSHAISTQHLSLFLLLLTLCLWIALTL